MFTGCEQETPAPRELLEIRPFVYAEPSFPLVPLGSGDRVGLWHAPQGGFVLLVGARVRGLDSDIVRVRARLVDPETSAPVAEHVRNALMAEVPGEPGWFENDRRSVTQVAHLAVCPTESGSDLLDRVLRLEVNVLELHADDSEGSAAVDVVLECPGEEPSIFDACRCDCRVPDGAPCGDATG